MAARVATAQSVTGRAQAKTGDRRTPVASMHVLSRATNRSANRNTDRDLTAADALHPRPSTRPSLENNGDFARTPLTQSRTLSSTSTPLRAPPSLRNSPVAVHLAAPQRGAAGTADLLACVGAVRHNPASCGSRRRILHDRSVIMWDCPPQICPWCGHVRPRSCPRPCQSRTPRRQKNPRILSATSARRSATASVRACRCPRRCRLSWRRASVRISPLCASTPRRRRRNSRTDCRRAPSPIANTSSSGATSSGLTRPMGRR